MKLLSYSNYLTGTRRSPSNVPPLTRILPINAIRDLNGGLITQQTQFEIALHGNPKTSGSSEGAMWTF